MYDIATGVGYNFSRHLRGGGFVNWGAVNCEMDCVESVVADGVSQVGSDGHEEACAGVAQGPMQAYVAETASGSGEDIAEEEKAGDFLDDGED